jgi:hypothetical protein
MSVSDDDTVEIDGNEERRLCGLTSGRMLQHSSAIAASIPSMSVMNNKAVVRKVKVKRTNITPSVVVLQLLQSG